MKKPATILEALIQAKEMEERAISVRKEIELEIYEMFKSDLKKESGQETIKELGFSITINRPVTWKLDEAKYRKLAESLPVDLQVHRTKIELDKKAYDFVMNLPGLVEKKFQKKISDCVSMNYGKVAVSVSRLED